MTSELLNLADSFFNLKPFDVLWRDLFDSSEGFFTLDEAKISYPVDVKETKAGLEIDIAAVGLGKKDIALRIEDGDTLIVEYDKSKEEESPQDGRYYRKGIARRSFRFAWKIAPKFNLDELEANMDKGLLQLKVPIAPESKPKNIEIK